MNIPTLGEARFTSPVRRTVSDQLRVPEQIVSDPPAPPADALLFELAGPRARLYFDPKQTRAGIFTWGGLCPGLNSRKKRLDPEGPAWSAVLAATGQPERFE